ncbi:uncharacterized protein At1g01500-like isoform X1 [Hibiscus syriacus]|uniref:uncharacterized protein At1g01500-like isoform X1 n=1 Tax=Hibiscus syriacus TaxID=106335 RepID=UPI001921315E|nr:uncharacterized protein At1g01500-like isoform X1 [Hibiscus syriacus]
MEGEWSMDCYMTTLAMEPGNSAYIQLKIGVSAPEIEVYIAGCCAGVPVILTKTIHVNSKNIGESRLRWLLDAILEDEEIGEGDNNNIRHRKSPSYYSEDMYADEDGQMCVGLGIGVGILMRSYRATTRNFRRTFQ